MPVTSMLMSTLGSGGGGGGIGQSTANMASGLLTGIVGFGQRKSGKKILKGLEQPTYNIPNEVLQNQKMAQQAAAEGLPSQQYNNAMKNIQRTQAALLSGATDRRSALMALPRIQQQMNDATMNLDTADANARMQNQRTLYGINNTVGQYRDKAFQINQMNPYERKYQYGMGLLGAGNQNIMAGADRFIAGGGQLLGGGGGGGSKKGGQGGEEQYYNEGIDKIKPSTYQVPLASYR